MRRYRVASKGWIENEIGYIGYIPLSRGLIAKVDPDMVAELEQYNWYAGKGGGKNGPSYAVRNASPRRKGSKRHIHMHRVVLGVTDPATLVDHINHDTLDNRRSNLRPATVTQNAQNSRKNVAQNRSGYKGVSVDKWSGRYLVTLKHHGKTVHIGRRDTPEEAHALYCEAATKLYGEFACFG